MKFKILYEDNHIIVVVKPSGILSQADNTKDDDMLSLIKEYIKIKYQKPGNVYLGLIHRLDRMTSGVMVFGKTSKASSRLSNDIRNHLFSKKYYAIVKGTISDSGEMVDSLIKNESTGISYVDKNGKEAKLKYKVVKRIDNLNLVDIELLTGRHHQIRVQFSSRNNPVLGDALYDEKYDGKLYLHAYSLSFNHPVTKEKMEFIENPIGGKWDLFFKE